MTTFPDLLDQRLRGDPGRPFVTFYDEASGERTELSVTTFANWVSKTANLFVDELMLDPGDTIRIDLPPHWLGPVFLGAAWSAGLVVTDAVGSVAVVTGPGTTWQETTTLACSLRPFAVRYADELAEGVLDYGLLWPGQSDVFSALDAVDVSAAPSDDRVLTDLDPVSAAGQALVLDALAGGGSLVLLTNAEEGQWPARFESERATVTIRSDQPIS